jgi:hypothetical protein
MSEHPWQPLSPADVARVFSRYRGHWWVAGGWGIDLALGRQTRAHGDIDVAVLRRDQRELCDALASWDVHVAHDGVLTPWDGEPLTAPRHQFWVREPDRETWAFEVLLEDAVDHAWVFRRDLRVRRPLHEIGAYTNDAVPYLRPVVGLLYKARHPEIDRNNADFAAALPSLRASDRAWLREAIRLTEPGHAWIARLSA